MEYGFAPLMIGPPWKINLVNNLRQFLIYSDLNMGIFDAYSDLWYFPHISLRKFLDFGNFYIIKYPATILIRKQMEEICN